ncbi:NAD(P)/FAD-dependent oxidoreductase [Salinicoccus hispanicus]|uniref:Type II NADH:quinone oxidoreductase n=1 Tax=Salinicoccus hispanicus TaxID=157225 RepID=A0A6N8U3N1_9STAP|nr:NAD(P)/FAD-dependent oxidoreductase [Salinicoccus hispanicus]MXQ50811.1 FAD-dependent oxidoreductase [Salinicoccus hispanicus]
MKNIVCLGGGYGNMRFIQRILPKLPSDSTITLVDKNPFHGLKTEYYALAAGTKSEKKVRVDFPDDDKVNIVYDTIKSIDLEGNKVILENRTLGYDTLIIGLGCEDKYHDVPGASEYTYSIQTLRQSRATYEKIGSLSPGAKVGIIGAGLSGIEVASELREARSDLTIKLFDRGDRILPMYPARLSAYVKRWFDENDVEVIPNSNIVKVETDKVYNNNDSQDLDMIIWTAGVQPAEAVRGMPVEFGAGGRVVLNQYHQIPGFENAYVVGDSAALEHAPSAQVAEGQAEQIAEVIDTLIKEKPLPSEMPEIKMQGILGSLGSKEGFAYLKERTVTGRIARMLKSGVLWMYKLGN